MSETKCKHPEDNRWSDGDVIVCGECGTELYYYNETTERWDDA